ncbi:penicillin-binding transpeptidase domain-containing protein [Sphaerisporangium fuscum]|uniref:penicillin-binding transpeptidase domain-containing protein n=1 Tax=Sphaerisporangium fuscum TaxID=2835868 RepID=UPI001BDD3660|nr:penicillin-binding transpeptidase domain-containing protein [Sphaerisporangium fuscum]
MRARWPVVMVVLVGLMLAFAGYAVLTTPDPMQTPLARTRRPSPTLTAQAPPVTARPAGTVAPVTGTTAPATGLPLPASPSTPPVQEGPGGTASRYFAAWQAGDLTSMAGLVADPPADFADRHRRFSADLRIASLSLTPGVPRLVGAEAAEVPFQGVRQVTGLGPWPFSSVLRLALRNGSWKVLWAPETLHPSLRDGGGVRLKENRSPQVLTREGRAFPPNSRAGDYFPGLDAAAVRLSLEEVPSGKVLLASPNPTQAGRRTTIAQREQTAAARALDGVTQPAAIVAVDVQSRQVRAVADTLGGRRAFNGLYPPGSAFKVVTAAALLGNGLTADSQVPCPASYTIPNARSFTNDGGADRGTVSLTMAFAHSCNTTFVQQTYEHLRGDQLRAEAADRFGFREKTGLSTCRIQPPKDLDELGADAIGQNSVQASPLCMAEVAAAVASGVWRPALMTDTPPAGSPPEVPLDQGVLDGVRAMMGAVVTKGTAAQAGLPSGTAGKTGTAEVKGASSHAWFVGYRGSLAFAVLVQNGGSGPGVAAPLAAKFLRALRD